jgi:hypothetical protein
MKAKNKIDRHIGIVVDLFTSKTIIIVIMTAFMGGIIGHLYNIFGSWLLALGAQATVLLLSINAKYLPSVKTKSGIDLPVLALLVSACISYLLYMDLQMTSKSEMFTDMWYLTMVKSLFISALELSYSFLFVARTGSQDFDEVDDDNEHVSHMQLKDIVDMPETSGTSETKQFEPLQPQVDFRPDIETEKVLVTDQDKAVFVEALLNPEPANQKLSKAIENHDKFMKDNAIESMLAPPKLEEVLTEDIDRPIVTVENENEKVTNVETTYEMSIRDKAIQEFVKPALVRQSNTGTAWKGTDNELSNIQK